VRVFDLMKPFKEVPKEKLDVALSKLDLWDFACVPRRCAASAARR